MKQNMEIKYPRILVVSNNSFSDTNNNGKTLASFFDKYPAENIAQLYFNPELPSNSRFDNYFRITDIDVVKSVFNKDTFRGGRLDGKAEDIKFQKGNGSLATIIKNNNLARIVRELFWKTNKWRTESLDQWLNEFSPEVVFFCAGDSIFAYDITRYIQNKFDAKLVVYITDDYVLPRKTLSPFWWLRRNLVLNKMNKTVQRSDLFITISQQMKDVYKELFGMDSFLAVNMSDSMKDNSINVENKEEVTLVYAGGLHYKRYFTLNLLAKAIKKYNKNVNNKKVYLKIYSGQEPPNFILKYLNIEGASEFCGKLYPTELRKVLNSCDIPVHVESFDHNSIESTRLSISTKIPEYLSLGKPILAIGPHQVASMEYLKDCAFCITDKKGIENELPKLFNGNELCESLSAKSILKYRNNHDKEKVASQLISKIIEVNRNA